MIMRNKQNRVFTRIFLFGLALACYTISVPGVSARTYDFDEGIEAVTNGLISESRAILKNKKIAVFGIIESNSGGKWAISSHIEDGIVDVLVNNGFRVIERRRIQDVIKEEIKKSTDLWFDQARVAQFGKLVGADFVVTGAYVLWGQGTLKISIRAISVVDGEIVAADKVQILTDRIADLLKPEEKKKHAEEAKAIPVKSVKPATEERKRLDREKLELEKVKTEIEGNRFREEQARLERERRESQKQRVEVASVPSKPSSTSNAIKRDGIYVAYANGIVKDTKSGLEWIAGPDKDTTWDEAKAWVAGLKTGGGGWRMPTMDELEGLYKEGMGSYNLTSLLLNNTLEYLWVWSGETDGSSFARSFYFNFGSRDWFSRGASDNRRGFAVRSQNDG